MLPSAKVMRRKVGFSIALLCAGLLVLLGLASLGLITLWPSSSKHPTLRATLGERDFASLSCLAFSPDGQMLASSSDGNIKLWDVATWQHVATFSGQQRTRASIGWERSCLPLATSQKLTSLLPATTSILPSGENHSELPHLPCAETGKRRSSLPVVASYRMVSVPPAAKVLS